MSAIKREWARMILKPTLDGMKPGETGLYSLGWYLAWNEGDREVVLDGKFSADELEAIAILMREPATQP